MAHRQHKSWSRTAGESIVALALTLPLFVPFSLERNIDMQVCIVWALGAMAWATLFLQRQRDKSLRSWLWWPVGLYCLSCVLTLWMHASVDNLIGLEHARLGVLTLLACIGCGLISRSASNKQLAWGLYVSSVTLAAITIPYTLLVSGNLSRAGGVFHQPDFLAIWLACGCIIGFGLWPKTSGPRYTMAATQTLLVATIVLTQTRAVLLLLFAVSALVALLELRSYWRVIAITCIASTALLIGTLTHIVMPHSRLIDQSYSNESVRYRLSLQSYGVSAVKRQPIFGYGTDGIPNGLSCLTFHDPALLKTCKQGYYFDSSHNIFLDRFIALGLVGGFAFIVAVGGLLYNGMRRTGLSRYFWYAALALCGYYLTNVTSVALELLLWLLLCRAWGHYDEM